MLDNIKNALASIWSNKVRSLLTVLGVVIGVSSVTTLVSLGQGLKNDVSKLIQGFGSNVIVVVAGKIDTSSGSTAGSNPANFIAGDILTQRDTEDIKSKPEILAVSPLSPTVGSLRKNDKTAPTIVFGAYPDILQALEISKIEKGKMFERNNSGNEIVLGPQAAESLFDSEDPIGKKVEYGKRELTVIGTLAKPKTTTVLGGGEMEQLSLIPFDTAKELNKDQTKILRIIAKAKDGADVKQVKNDINTIIKKNHDGEEDFTVLTQDDILDLFGQFLTLATTMVSAIAAISLIVGGIGIMNIMLVTVTERTKEIGLRKAVGATRLAIGFQFLVEAIVITLFGGIIGLAISFTVGAIVASQTPLTPAITPEVILTAVGISVVVGIIFGLWPALRAAKKDPIEALRYE